MPTVWSSFLRANQRNAAAKDYALFSTSAQSDSKASFSWATLKLLC